MRRIDVQKDISKRECTHLKDCRYNQNVLIASMLQSYVRHLMIELFYIHVWVWNKLDLNHSLHINHLGRQTVSYHHTIFICSVNLMINYYKRKNSSRKRIYTNRRNRVCMFNINLFQWCGIIILQWCYHNRTINQTSVELSTLILRNKSASGTSFRKNKRFRNV